MIKALNDYIFLSYDKKKEEKSGIILSDVSKDKSAIMKVESVGDKAEKVKAGDMVVIDPFLPREIKIENKQYYIIQEKNIFAIIKQK